ncbi:MAG: hypothetical protein GY720_15905 [bacterium]|nr:hypothetical protein [bacterium]
MKQVLPVLLLLTACGAQECDPCAMPTDVFVRFSESLPDGLNGWTEVVSGETQITVRRIETFVGSRQIVAHELMHAAGLVNHSPSDACLFSAGSGRGIVTSPCVSERERLDEIRGTFRVDCERAIEAEVLWAIDVLNEAVGRAMYEFVH